MTKLKFIPNPPQKDIYNVVITSYQREGVFVQSTGETHLLIVAESPEDYMNKLMDFYAGKPNERDTIKCSILTEGKDIPLETRLKELAKPGLKILR